MKKIAISAVVAGPAIFAGALSLTPTNNAHHYDYKLVDDEALVIIPVENQEFADAAANLYLQPNGFTIDPGYTNVNTLDMPEVVQGGTLDDAVSQGEQSLVSTIVADYKAGDMADGPLYVFGYSQSDVVMGDAEAQLAADGVPKDALDFVMVGDSASAEGGFLNTYIDSLPSWEQSLVTEAFQEFGAGNVLGATTPDNLYPTQVYGLSGDGWANYDGGANDLGMYSDHLEYLGLTAQEIASAGAPNVDGLTDYFTIQDSMVNSLEALWTQLQIADSVLF
jgi:hypothetical protein